MIALWVALAGGLGAVARFIVDAEVARVNRGQFPLGTLVINVTGSLLLGLLTGAWMFHGASGELKAVLGTGFLGGYTTFSTACVESARLARSGRRWVSVVHAAGMVIASVLAAGVGLWAMAW